MRWSNEPLLLQTFFALGMSQTQKQMLINIYVCDTEGTERPKLTSFRKSTSTCSHLEPKESCIQKKINEKFDQVQDTWHIVTYYHSSMLFRYWPHSSCWWFSQVFFEAHFYLCLSFWTNEPLNICLQWNKYLNQSRPK